MRTGSFAFFAAALLPSAALAGTSVINGDWPVIQGSGRIVRQVRPVAPFTSVELDDSTDLEVRLGSTRSLTVEADDNLLPLLTTEVRGDTLVVASHGSYRTQRTPRVWLTVPDLREVRVLGSGDVRLVGVANAGLSLNIEGSGDVEAVGRTGMLDATIEGSGDFKLRGLYARNARVRIMGSGDATVAVSGALDANVSGSGDVRYIGHPSWISVRKDGSGSVSQIGG
jgi:hypothetical protein